LKQTAAITVTAISVQTNQ